MLNKRSIISLINRCKLELFIQNLFRSSAHFLILLKIQNHNYVSILSIYSFTAPAVIPSMKYLWKHKNRIKIGIMENTEPTTNRL